MPVRLLKASSRTNKLFAHFENFAKVAIKFGANTMAFMQIFIAPLRAYSVQLMELPIISVEFCGCAATPNKAREFPLFLKCHGVCTAKNSKNNSVALFGKLVKKYVKNVSLSLLVAGEFSDLSAVENHRKMV